MKIHTSPIPEDDAKFEKNLADIKHEQVEAEKRQQELIKKRIEQQKKAHKQKLDRERIEMLKQKQNLPAQVIAQKETVVAEKLTGKKAIANFWYHYNMFVILGVVFAVLATIFIVNIIATPKPDLNIMILAEDGYTQKSEDVAKFLSELVPDINQDGENIIGIMNCPIGSNKNDPTADPAYYTKFYGELQSGETMLYISNEKCDVTLMPETIMYDLTELYPDNPKVTKYGFALNGEKIEKFLDWEGMPQDSYIGIRMPEKISGQTQEKAKKQFEEAMLFMDVLIREFS